MVVPRRILLTNDDGIEAAGLEVLARAFEDIGDVEIWIVAPDRERSTCSHGMTLGRPIRSRQVGPRRFAVDGLPADCVYLALSSLLPERPEVVVSGVNASPNLGSDVIYSGTVAGAREAALRGVHGVAVSMAGEGDFRAAASSAARIAVDMSEWKRKPALLLNLNYPKGTFEGPFLAPLGTRTYPEKVDSRHTANPGESDHWLGSSPVVDALIPGTDGWLVANGKASATFLSLDQTDRTMHRCADDGRFGLFPWRGESR